MVETYDWFVYRESKVEGCEFEDGSDTREYKDEIVLVPVNREERYMEYCADEMGYQDYSYQFNTKKIARLTHQEILEISHKWIMALELHDVVNDKKKFEEIVNKLKHCIEAIENGKL